MNTRKTGTVGDRPERGRVAVLIIVILAAVLALAAGGVAAKGRMSNDIIVRDTAEDVLRAAADFVEETGSEPWDVEVYHDVAGSQWVVELIWP